MLPLPFSAAILLRVPFTVDISVIIDIAIYIDVDTMAAPIPMSPCIPPGNTDCDSGRKSVKRWTRIIGRVVIVGRIMGPPPGSVDNGGVVDRHVNNLRLWRLDDDHFLLDLDNLFLCGLEVVGIFRLLA
jgi:hypothetical protein